MSKSSTTQLIQEICAYIYEHGTYPPRGHRSNDGIDLGKALTRYRSGETALTKDQIELLAHADDFLSRTERNIRELEIYYQQHGCLPLGEKNHRLTDVMGSYKSGQVPLTEVQKHRLELIGVLLDSTERMIRAIEAYCDRYHRAPVRGMKSPEGYDMGSALIGYRSGKRKLTLTQKMRLEAKGILLPNATIKEERPSSVRIVGEKPTLAQQIQSLKAEKETLIGTNIESCYKLK